MPRLTHRVALVAPALLAVAVLAGCAGAEATPPASDAPAEALTIDNCGTEITVDSPPQRILTIKSTTLELLLALGVEDRIIGSAYSDGPVPEKYADAAADIPVVSDKLPSQEAALAAEPDFIFGGWESNFSIDGVGERDTLQSLGISTYVAPSACKAPEYMPDPLTFDTVFDEFTQAGEIFGAEDAATKLVTEQRAQLDALKPDSRDLTAVWYSSGRDEPYVGAGIGAPAMLMDAAGLQNAFADEHDTWISASWEKVAEVNPDVLVLIGSPGNTVEDKIALLTSNPVTSTMDAVVNRHFVTLDFAAAEAGVRNVDSVAALIDQLGGL
ncbi:putative F420-0 ABC transporter substrate-binding protein [Microbacterium sp. H1-D42]|uniref:putative F420-0 ABC transporter substrate-binding protein n=1 Tax=Microbacterium sp. H1-D42 TaxID=2925844 RepID=UPI001F52D79B|nr:putative F420-0 ABC transporter substrate-binding protein [Microbacterium sp. H1-D42]UNK70922.1 putative F420-0 ABC transporter substrate-binding protein [Microbacterium sp. H1-D42]